MEYLLKLDVSDFIPSRDVPKNNMAKEIMIHNSINPFDARKWLEECCATGMIIGHKKDENFNQIAYEKSDLPWEPWKTGKEYENGIFYAAYREWQKSIKSPIAARPTAINKFGELLNSAGFDQRNQGRRLRKLPDPENCKKILEKMF